jgi:cysteine desulfurase
MDYQATTPVDPRVLEAMLPYLTERFGNASSKSHLFGWEAETAVRLAREQCATILNAEPIEIVFTSGSTEGINLAMKGIAATHRDRGDHLVTCATEHPAVLDCAAHLERDGFTVTRLGVDRCGSIDLDELRAAITRRTVLVALMFANNEIGTLHPLAAIGRICRERNVPLLCDATQGVGKLPIDVREMHVDLLTFSAHKLYGPKGAGALYVRKSEPHLRIAAQVHGGGQEGGLRAGTLNVPGIVGLGKACELARQELATEPARLTALRQRLHDGIAGGLDEVVLNGHPEQRLPGNLNLAFRHVSAEALMADLPDVALSSGSACSSAQLEASHVLTAIGLEPELAHSSLRFGLGRMTTEDEVDRVVEKVVGSVRRLREMSPLYELAKKGRPGRPVL